jgi:hypothetical protein
MNECWQSVDIGTMPAGPSQPVTGTADGICAGQRRVWDSNPRGSSRTLAVFKTRP